MLARTRATEPGVAPSVGLLGAAALAVALVLTLRSEPIAGMNGDPPIPADILALGTEVRPASPEGKISADQAIRTENVGGTLDGATVATYLVTLTNPNLAGGIAERDVWIVRVSGIAGPVSIPDVPAGVPRPSIVNPDVLYSLVDARTGEWIMSMTGAP